METGEVVALLAAVVVPLVAALVFVFQTFLPNQQKAFTATLNTQRTDFLAREDARDSTIRDDRQSDQQGYVEQLREMRTERADDRALRETNISTMGALSNTVQNLETAIREDTRTREETRARGIQAMPEGH